MELGEVLLDQGIGELREGLGPELLEHRAHLPVTDPSPTHHLPITLEHVFGLMRVRISGL
jgi:hypothetical protein